MTGNNPSSVLNNHGRKPLNILRLVTCFMVLLVSFPNVALANNEAEYDTIPVFVNVQNVGGEEIPAIIKDQVVYLSVTDVFDFLKIKNDHNAGIDSVYGFFIEQQRTFSIDKYHHRITYQGKVYQLNPDDILQAESNLYLRLDYFGQVFGLECTFSFRNLSIAISTKLELPVVREMRQELMRRNINQLRGNIRADTNIARSYPLFHLGMADWAFVSSQEFKKRNDGRFNLTLGGVVAGGEMNVALNYYSNMPFTEKQQFYLWRLANNNHQALRQVMAGKIYTHATSSIYDPVVGVQFTNTPTTYRRSFGSYRLSDQTEPGWLVELYVNNVLVNYVKADASGFYTFEVPLVYGNSMVKLRFYGPWGEERTTEQDILIPFNFLPARQFEYTVSAGVVEDSTLSRFSKTNINYGVGRHFTVGAGMEYLSSVTSGKSMPFVNASLSVGANLLLSGEYTYGVRSKSVLTYRLPSNAQFELNYTKYAKGQTAIRYPYLEERKLAFSIPVRGKNFSAFSRITVYQIVLPYSKYTTSEWLVSGNLFGVNTNFTTYALFTQKGVPYKYSNLAMTFRLPYKFIFSPQFQYEYNQNKFIGMKYEVGKYISSRGYFNVFYEKNYKSNINNVGLSLRYDFSFAQIGLSLRRSNQTTTLIETASGSLMYDGNAKYLGTGNRTSVGRGGIIVMPYLDINGNGKKDKDEPKVTGLIAHINGGKIQYVDRDTIITVSNLEAYITYYMELDAHNLDNISWQIKKQSFNITIDPNQFKVIEVPVMVVSEVSGMVYFKDAKGMKGLGRILVNFYRSDSTLAGHTLTEADGSFSFTELTAGTYTAKVDEAQLKKLQFNCLQGMLPFTIIRAKDGDSVNGLEFILQANQQNAEPKVE